MKWMPWRERALTVKVELDRRSGILKRKTVDMKKINRGRTAMSRHDGS